MKQFTIEVSNASGPQLATIALELKLMSHGWTKFGPRITINKKKLEALELRVPSHKRPQAPSRQRHNMARFI